MLDDNEESMILRTAFAKIMPKLLEKLERSEKKLYFSYAVILENKDSRPKDSTLFWFIQSHTLLLFTSSFGQAGLHKSKLFLLKQRKSARTSQ